MNYKYIKLKYLIMGVVIVGFILTMSSNLWSAYRMTTQSLTDNTLETNRVYAQKLASTADRYIEETITTLAFSANYLKDYMDDEKVLASESERLRTQNNMFNSVIVADEKGLVIGTSPPSLELKGVTLKTEGPLEALSKRQPLISTPYKSTTGRLIIFISHPIFDDNNQFIGLVGGSIYLEEDNIFHSILGQHFYDDGSYVFVVDRDGRVIYHVDRQRLNDVVLDNEIVEKVVKGEQGAQAVTNTKGVEMLAGYSHISHAGWGVIAQRPSEAALVPAWSMVKKLAVFSLPLVLIGLAFVLWLAVKIAMPLQQMAMVTERSLKTKELDEFETVSSWYNETFILKNALVKCLGILHKEVSFFKTQSTTDPLTGLTNRRTMDERLQTWTEEQVPYAVLLVDLDRFKSINDTYGHSVGDEVLKYLAEKMLFHTREQDVCCRFGGEEFVVLLPSTSESEAMTIAENLRSDLEKTNSPCGRPVTMSGGIALATGNGDAPDKIIERADRALYEAKQAGRNLVLMASLQKI